MNNKLYNNSKEVGSVEMLKIFGGIFIFIVVFFLAYLYGAFTVGFVGMKLWSWFIVPVFGLPNLSWGQAYGISLISGLFTHQFLVNTNKDEREKHQKIGHMIACIILPWITLILGWIGKTWFL